jgi:ribosomal-protein-serine acetyltransferase
MIEGMFYREMGDGLRWRLATILDAAELFEIIERNRAEFGRWLPWVEFTKTVEDEKNFIRESGEKWARMESMLGVVELDGRIVAAADPTVINLGEHWAEIGYWCDKAFTGRGIITRTVRHIQAFCFEELGLDRVQIRADVGNLLSRAIPERLGYTLEGILRRTSPQPDGTMGDFALYSLLKDEWQANS